jgi:hypothetical protein
VIHHARGRRHLVERLLIDGRRSLRELEERNAVAAADVEEIVLAASAWKIDRLHERHAEHTLVERDRAIHVGAYEREMIDTASLEFLCHRLLLRRTA